MESLEALDKGVRDFIRMPIQEKDAMLRIRNALEIRWLNRAVQEQKRELEMCTYNMYKSQCELVRLLGNVAEIIRGSGTHFNPDLVALFVDTFDELVSIKEQYNECLVTKVASV